MHINYSKITMNKNLFRPEVILAKKSPNYGSIFINTPYPYTVITAGVISIIMLIFLFGLLEDFSQKFTVQGYLNPTKNIVKVFANRPGIISRKIKVGDAVKKGQPLFIVDTSFSNQTTQDMLSHLQNRENILTTALTRHKTQLQLLKKLADQKYISRAIYNEGYNEFLNLKNELNAAEMELIRYKNECSYTIYSPIDGTITSVMVQTGQFTNGTKPLLKILPANTKLMAELFIPVRQAGFLAEKQGVLLRYDAYPYEQFGSATARITHVDQSVLTDEEDDKPLRIDQPYYRATAQLEKQITIDGRIKNIQAGMTFRAVIIGPKRKLWQWLFLPLINYSKNKQ